MEKLSRRRKLEVGGGFHRHLPTSNVQQSHQANKDATQPTRARIPSDFATKKVPLRILRYKKCHLGSTPCSASVGSRFGWWDSCTFEVGKWWPEPPRTSSFRLRPSISMLDLPTMPGRLPRSSRRLVVIWNFCYFRTDPEHNPTFSKSIRNVLEKPAMYNLHISFKLRKLGELS